MPGLDLEKYSDHEYMTGRMLPMTFIVCVCACACARTLSEWHNDSTGVCLCVCVCMCVCVFVLARIKRPLRILSIGVAQCEQRSVFVCVSGGRGVRRCVYGGGGWGDYFTTLSVRES